MPDSEATRALTPILNSTLVGLFKTFYGELTRKIRSIRFDPHGDDFRRFLGQLSWLGLPLFDEEPFAAGSSG